MPQAKWRAATVWVDSTFARAATQASVGIALPPAEHPDWDACEAESARQTAMAVRLAAATLVGFVLTVWPLDLLILDRDPAQQAIFTQWRLFLLADFTAMYLVMRYSRLAQRFPVLTALPFCAAGAAFLASSVSLLGGLDVPFFYMLGAVLFVPAGAVANFPVRVLFVAALVLALFLGYFLTTPGHASHPLFSESLIYLTSVGAGSCLLGHAVYVGSCQRFFQGLALSRSSQELTALTRVLDQRVREKTAELARLADHLQVVQEEERGRIARDLHDELGQQLSAIRFVLATTPQKYAQGSEEVIKHVADLDAMVHSALECTRLIVSELRPPILEQLGLPAALQWLTQQMATRARLTHTVVVQGEQTTGQTMDVAVFRVLQEALTNVVRHAGASHVSVELRLFGTQLELDVQDDGHGFEPAQQAQQSQRHGIIGMRERANAQGGSLVTENRPGGGARVLLTVPLKPTDSAEVT